MTLEKKIRDQNILIFFGGKAHLFFAKWMVALQIKICDQTILYFSLVEKRVFFWRNGWWALQIKIRNQTKRFAIRPGARGRPTRKKDSRPNNIIFFLWWEGASFFRELQAATKRGKLEGLVTFQHRQENAERTLTAAHTVTPSCHRAATNAKHPPSQLHRRS